MSDGFELTYRSWAKGGEADRVVLGLHGIGGHLGNFDAMGETIPTALPGTEIVAIDRRGFGNSVEEGHQRGDVSSFKRYLLDDAEACREVRSANPGKKFYLFGKSLGCIHAIRLTASHPDLADGLILAAPPIKTKVGVPPALVVRVMFDLVFSPDKMIDAGKYQSKEFKEGEEKARISEDTLTTLTYSARYLYGVSGFVRSGLKHAALVRAPTLVMQGDADSTVDPTGAQQLLDTLVSKDKTLRLFKGADHGFYDTIPPRMNSKYDESSRKPVYDCVADWLRAH
jgi:acylglycerol lipase